MRRRRPLGLGAIAPLSVCRRVVASGVTCTTCSFEGSRRCAPQMKRLFDDGSRSNFRTDARVVSTFQMAICLQMTDRSGTKPLSYAPSRLQGTSPEPGNPRESGIFDPQRSYGDAPVSQAHPTQRCCRIMAVLQWVVAIFSIIPITPICNPIHTHCYLLNISVAWLGLHGITWTFGT